MAQKDWYTNIMLDLECASVDANNPVLLELAAVHFDIDTGKELGHYSSIISYQSCLDHNLVDDLVNGADGETTKFLKRDPVLKHTLFESKASQISLERVLGEFTKFVEESCQRTLEILVTRSPPRRYTQPMIWGNGAVADNVWITSAYKACNVERPWKFYNNMCVRTFVQQAKIMTGRDFRSEIENGQKHHALSDCRAQVDYLVNARNALMPQPMVRMLPSPETSFSSAEVQVEQVFRRGLPSPEASFSSVGVRLEQILTRQLPGPEDPFLSTDIIDDQQVLRSTATSLDEFDETLSEHQAFLEILTASQEVSREEETEVSVVTKSRAAAVLLSPETSFSSADGDDVETLRSAASSLLEPSSSGREALPGMFVPCNVSTSMNTQEQDMQKLITIALTQNSTSGSPNGCRARDVPYKVTKSAPNGNQRRRGAQVKTPRQLLTPETSFNAKDIEKESELSMQQDQRPFSS